MATQQAPTEDTVTAFIAHCRFCPASRIWDSGYVFREKTAMRLYELHLQSVHPGRYAKMVKRRLKESGSE